MKKKIIFIAIAVTAAVGAAAVTLGINAPKETILASAYDEQSIEQLKQELPEPDRQHVEEMEAQGYATTAIQMSTDKDGHFFVDLTFEKDNAPTHP